MQEAESLPVSLEGRAAFGGLWQKFWDITSCAFWYIKETVTRDEILFEICFLSICS